MDRLAAFYRKFYQPDDAVLVITGRIDEAKTLQMVADSMGKLPRPRACSIRPTRWSLRRTASGS